MSTIRSYFYPFLNSDVSTIRSFDPTKPPRPTRPISSNTATAFSYSSSSSSSSYVTVSSCSTTTKSPFRPPKPTKPSKPAHIRLSSGSEPLAPLTFKSAVVAPAKTAPRDSSTPATGNPGAVKINESGTIASVTVKSGTLTGSASRRSDSSSVSSEVALQPGLNMFLFDSDQVMRFQQPTMKAETDHSSSQTHPSLAPPLVLVDKPDSEMEDEDSSSYYTEPPSPISEMDATTDDSEVRKECLSEKTDDSQATSAATSILASPLRPTDDDVSDAIYDCVTEGNDEDDDGVFSALSSAIAAISAQPEPTDDEAKPARRNSINLEVASGFRRGSRTADGSPMGEWRRKAVRKNRSLIGLDDSGGSGSGDEERSSYREKSPSAHQPPTLQRRNSRSLPGSLNQETALDVDMNAFEGVPAPTPAEVSSPASKTKRHRRRRSRGFSLLFRKTANAGDVGMDSGDDGHVEASPSPTTSSVEASPRPRRGSGVSHFFLKAMDLVGNTSPSIYLGREGKPRDGQRSGEPPKKDSSGDDYNDAGHISTPIHAVARVNPPPIKGTLRRRNSRFGNEPFYQEFPLPYQKPSTAPNSARVSVEEDQEEEEEEEEEGKEPETENDKTVGEVPNPAADFSSLLSVESREDNRPASFHSAETLLKERDAELANPSPDTTMTTTNLKRSNSERGTKGSVRRRNPNVSPSSSEYYRKAQSRNNDTKRRERRKTTENILGGGRGDNGVAAVVNAIPTRWSDTPEVLAAPGVVEALTKREKRHQEAMFELITSEASFLRSLDVLIDVFMEAPEINEIEDEEGGLMDRRHRRNDRRRLFSNILVVRESSDRFLELLERRWEEENPTLSEICDIVDECIGSCFEPAYVPYCRNQRFQEKKLKDLDKTDPKFFQAIRKLEAKPECRFLTLNSFLLLPMQRVTRLPLLMEAVVKQRAEMVKEEMEQGREEKENEEGREENAEASGNQIKEIEKKEMEETGSKKATLEASWKRACETLNRLKALARRCNEAAIELDRMEKMVKLDNQIKFDDQIKSRIPIVSESRHVEREGDVIR